AFGAEKEQDHQQDDQDARAAKAVDARKDGAHKSEIRARFSADCKGKRLEACAGKGRHLPSEDSLHGQVGSAFMEKPVQSEKVPTSFKVEVYFWTRDYRVLFGLVAVVLLAGGLLAMKVSGRSAPEGATPWMEVNPGRIVTPLEQLEKALATAGEERPEDERAHEVATLLWALDLEAQEETEEAWSSVYRLIGGSDLSAARKQLYTEFAKSIT